jgi:hypothetical protein
MLAALGGCVSTEGGRYVGETWNSGGGPGCAAIAPPMIPGAQGAWGQPVPVRGPYAASPPSGEAAARAMIANSMPLDLVQQVGYAPAGPMPPGGMMHPGAAMTPPGSITPPGVPLVPGAPGMAVAGMGGPPPGAVAAVGALTGAYQAQFAAPRSSVRFVGPPGLKVSWYAPSPDGKRTFSPTPLEVPGRYNFVQGAIYRLKLSDIPDHPLVELYPTLEVVPANAKTATFLAHSSIPVSFTPDDFRMVAAGNYVVKVIYLPDPQFQDVAVTGTDELISTQLEPGVDPIAEACKRGSILLIVRLGNIDLEAKHTPAMDAPAVGAAPVPPATMPAMGPMPPGMMTGRPGPMVPGLMPPGAGMMPPGRPGPLVPGAPLPPAGGAGVPARGAGLTLPPAPPAATQPSGGRVAAPGTLTPAQMAGQGGR